MLLRSTSFSGLYRIKTLLEANPADETCRFFPLPSAQIRNTNVSVIKRTQADRTQLGTFVDSNIWTIIEMCCAVISACLPTLRPLLSKITHTFSSKSHSIATTAISRVRQTRTQSTNVRRESDSTEYLPIYTPLSKINSEAPPPLPSKELDTETGVRTSIIHLPEIRFSR